MNDPFQPLSCEMRRKLQQEMAGERSNSQKIDFLIYFGYRIRAA